MPLNPTFWKADSITGAPNNNLATMVKKVNDTGITFKCKSDDADHIRDMAGEGFFKYTDLNQYANSADKIRHELPQMMVYKRTSLISGLRKIFVEGDFVNTVNGPSPDDNGGRLGEWYDESFGETKFVLLFIILFNYLDLTFIYLMKTPERSLLSSNVCVRKTWAVRHLQMSHLTLLVRFLCQKSVANSPPEITRILMSL